MKISNFPAKQDHALHDKFQISQQGFTLIELLVVLAIMIAVFIFGYAQYRDYSRRQILAEATNTLKADLQFVQQKANSGEKPAGCTGTLHGYIVSFSSSFYSLYANCSLPSFESAADPLIRTVNFPPSVSKRSGPSMIFFKVLSEGTTSASDDVIELIQPSTQLFSKITVTKGGSVY